MSRVELAAQARVQAAEALLTVCSGVVLIAIIPQSRSADVGLALRVAYQSTADEVVPDALLELLRTLQ